MNIKTLRFVGTLEGISFLLLLGVAMPIKYIWDNPVFVKYIGMGHGVLFLLFFSGLAGCLSPYEMVTEYF